MNAPRFADGLRLGRALAAILVLFASKAVAADGGFRDDFEDAGILEETGSMSESASPDWWLNSGARFIRADGVGRTLQGPLPEEDRWRMRYAGANARDTENGLYPQSLFRLLTRRRWLDSSASVSFRLRAVHSTDTPERGGWSGILLFARYVDSDNLYYAGLRHDGTAVVKRKQAGKYVTLAERRVVNGAYDRVERPNLLPVDRWLGLRLITRTDEEHRVALRLDARGVVPEPDWVTVLTALDDGSKGGTPIPSEGSCGIRSDYMDVELDDFEVRAPD